MTPGKHATFLSHIQLQDAPTQAPERGPHLITVCDGPGRSLAQGEARTDAVNGLWAVGTAQQVLSK